MTALTRSCSGRRPLRLATAPQSELAFAPDDEQACTGNDDRTGKNESAGQLMKEKIAEQERPYHRGVIERRNQRGRRPAIAFGEQDVGNAAAQPDRDQGQ